MYMNDVTFFHMDEKDFSNKIYKDLYSTKIDLYDLRETYVMCSLDMLDEISTRLPTHSKDKLYFLGNGNYHYLTLVLLDRLKDPFTLVTFDHHNDAGYIPFPQMTSCGSWIQTALGKFDLLEEVFIIGADADNMKETKSELNDKLYYLNADSISEKSLQKISTAIPTENIYLSIDRDFLSEKEVQTNWDQGDSPLTELLFSIQLLCADHKLIGADVCGDIIWDYRTLNKYTMQAVLKQSINVNNKIFDQLSLQF
ncbi:MAG TPA: arginase family protein [Atopostipes sp.]|nr:arginase family protein [Atopostipes sp.]